MKSTFVQVWWVQAITWANDDPDVCHYMVAPGHSKLKESVG